jgi:catechol 2,3-dioxygenase-like lactoylglutathione lyase family enzyme
MITGVHHVQITIPKGAEQAGRAFYCGVLGLTEIRKPESLQARGGFWLSVGDRQMHVGVEDGVDRRATKAHVAYAVNDLEGWRARLSREGISVEDGVKIAGCRRFEFRDPFGNRVEMTEATPSTPE